MSHEEAPGEKSRIGTQSKQQSALRVLIVEDEAIIAMELEMVLEELEAQIVGIAMSADEAEALAAMHRPDFITMDINIKGDRDGVSAAHAIWEKYSIRSVFVSAYSDLATKQRAETCYPLGWIKKPAEKAAFAEILDKLRASKA